MKCQTTRRNKTTIETLADLGPSVITLMLFYLSSGTVIFASYPVSAVREPLY